MRAAAGRPLQAAHLPTKCWSPLVKFKFVRAVQLALATSARSGHEERMMSLAKFLSAGLAAALAVAPVQASPIVIGSQPHVSGMTQVQWHGRGGWGYRGGWGRGGWGYRGHGGWGSPWPFIGFGAAIIAGAIIADQAYRPHPGHYYDEGRLRWTLLLSRGLSRRSARDLPAELPHLRMAHGLLHDLLRPEAVVPLLARHRATASRRAAAAP